MPDMPFLMKMSVAGCFRGAANKKPLPPAHDLQKLYFCFVKTLERGEGVLSEILNISPSPHLRGEPGGRCRWGEGFLLLQP